MKTASGYVHICVYISVVCLYSLMKGHWESSHFIVHNYVRSMLHIDSSTQSLHTYVYILHVVRTYTYMYTRIYKSVSLHVCTYVKLIQSITDELDSCNNWRSPVQ